MDKRKKFDMGFMTGAAIPTPTLGRAAKRTRLTKEKGAQNRRALFDGQTRQISTFSGQARPTAAFTFGQATPTGAPL